MKKLILLIMAAVLTIGVSAQSTVSSLTTTTSINDADWVMLVQAGNSRKIAVSNLLQNVVLVADTATMLDPYPTLIETRDEIADSLNALRNSAIEGSTLYVELLPDSTAVADDYTLVLGDAGNDIYVTKATHVEITIPPNVDVAIPIRTTINFFQAGAGGVRFIAGAGVNLYSLKDSVQTDGIRSVAALKKRGTNNWVLYGNLQQ